MDSNKLREFIMLVTAEASAETLKELYIALTSLQTLTEAG